MSEKKKSMLVVTILGIVFFVGGILTLLIAIKTPHYNATVTEITDTYTTRERSGKTRKKRYNEKVSVVYVGKDGNEKTASDVRIKRSSKSQLPKVGDTVQIRELFGVGEYKLITPIAVSIVFWILGITLFISAIRLRR